MSNANGFQLSTAPVRITMLDADSGIPLEGAFFDLESRGRIICSGSTDTDGNLKFCLSACCAYELYEFLPPVDYEPEPSVFSIYVDYRNRIFVNGSHTDHITLRSRKKE